MVSPILVDAATCTPRTPLRPGFDYIGVGRGARAHSRHHRGVSQNRAEDCPASARRRPFDGNVDRRFVCQPIRFCRERAVAGDGAAFL